MANGNSLTAIVTGAAGGIGRALIKRLVKREINLVLVDLSEEVLQEMILETERLILRPFKESDAADVLEYLAEPAVTCFECLKLNSPEEAKEAFEEYENSKPGRI